MFVISWQHWRMMIVSWGDRIAGNWLRIPLTRQDVVCLSTIMVVLAESRRLGQLSVLPDVWSLMCNSLRLPPARWSLVKGSRDLRKVSVANSWIKTPGGYLRKVISDLEIHGENVIWYSLYISSDYKLFRLKYNLGAFTCRVPPWRQQNCISGSHNYYASSVPVFC